MDGCSRPFHRNTVITARRLEFQCQLSYDTTRHRTSSNFTFLGVETFYGSAGDDLEDNDTYEESHTLQSALLSSQWRLARTHSLTTTVLKYTAMNSLVNDKSPRKTKSAPLCTEIKEYNCASVSGVLDNLQKESFPSVPFKVLRVRVIE